MQVAIGFGMAAAAVRRGEGGEALEGEIHVTVIATGFEGGNQYVPQRTLRTELSDTAAQTNLEINESGVRIPAFLQNRQNRDQD